MKMQNNQLPAWDDYLGDMLRGHVPVNQLIPRHPYVLDTLKLGEVLQKNTEHIMLLTIDEAYAVMDTLYNKSTSYVGSIKDAASAAKNIAKLVSYKDAGKLVFNLKGLGIKAEPYLAKGVTYIKISGYPSLRRILNGTRYAVNNPKILELGIGKAGIDAGILSGARFCIYFSAAQRAVEFIFSSEHEVAKFIGNITMDVAKVLVTMFVTKISLTIVTGIATSLSIVIPISLGIIIVVSLGVLITAGLIYLDGEYSVSKNVIASIKKGMQAHQDIIKWNIKHNTPFLLSINNGNH